MPSRIAWRASILDTLRRIGPATLGRLAEEVAGGAPTRSQLSACARACRRMTHRGELVAGQAVVDTGRPERCYGLPGEELPQAKSLRAIAREVRTSRETVRRRLLTAQNGTVPFRASGNLAACVTVLARRVAGLKRLLGQPEAFAAERDGIVAALRGLPLP